MIDENLKLVGSGKVGKGPQSLHFVHAKDSSTSKHCTIYGQFSQAQLHLVMIDVSRISTNQRHYSQLWSKEGNGRCVDGRRFGSDFFNQ